MKIKIHVTKEILKKSATCVHAFKSCAIALAIREIAPKAGVGHMDIAFGKYIQNRIWWNGGKSCDYSNSALPAEAIDFIKRFDRSGYNERLAMNPISFEVDFPDSMVEKIGIDELTKILESSETLELA